MTTINWLNDFFFHIVFRREILLKFRKEKDEKDIWLGLVGAWIQKYGLKEPNLLKGLEKSPTWKKAQKVEFSTFRLRPRPFPHSLSLSLTHAHEERKPFWV